MGIALRILLKGGDPSGSGPLIAPFTRVRSIPASVIGTAYLEAAGLGTDSDLSRWVDVDDRWKVFGMWLGNP